MNGSDPKPWLEEGPPSPELRSLLESARADEPSAQQLASLAAKLSPLLVLPAVAVAPAAAAGQAGAAAGKAATVAAAAAKTGLAVKVLVTVGAVAAVGSAFQAGRVYEDKVAPPKMIERPVVVVAPPAPAPEPVVVPEPAPVVEPQPAPAPALKPQVKPAAPKPEAEAAMLEQAMTSLKAGDAKKALALCERHARELGANGLLVQEREVIAIEALVRLGRGADAKARAEKFKKAFPTSTHLLKVESLIGE